ncbi:hypothetical protein C2845_PM09G01910 [Panicum miliaceum]|uniref:Uncharacterized protein n=1 Tax=Panicum miliaceum TaxID=4540 RepID=A0A3L6RZA2_PANMI|nr:hypothetical protein C2845_PM09G01910 [Panicum miliaceum]
MVADLHMRHHQAIHQLSSDPTPARGVPLLLRSGSRATRKATSNSSSRTCVQ